MMPMIGIELNFNSGDVHEAILDLKGYILTKHIRQAV